MLSTRWVHRRRRGLIRRAILRCFDIAVDSLEEDADLGPPPAWIGKMLTGISVGIGGFFGMSSALPFELPIPHTTIVPQNKQRSGESSFEPPITLSYFLFFNPDEPRPRLAPMFRPDISQRYR